MKIIGTGHYTPKKCLTNSELSMLVDTNNEWIESRTGIKQRFITVDENTSDLAFEAASRAIKRSGICAEEIGLIVVATCTPDGAFPSVASLVQKHLNIPNAMAFDINAACSGFIYALTITQKLLLNSQFQYALVIGAETLSKIVNWQDRNTCVLFGDGAGAVVIEQKDNNHLLYEQCLATPDQDEVLVAGGLPIKNLYNQESTTDYYLKMQGQAVFKFAVNTVVDSINQLLTNQELNVNEIDYIVCHQANIRILKKITKSLGISQSCVYSNIDKYGNTSAASIPIALNEMVEKGLLHQGMNIILVGFGAGLTWGTSLIKW